MKEYDVIVIGGGAAGLTAAIFTSRRKLKTMVVSIDTGGQTNLTNKISNYPGFLEKSGPKLMGTFKKQAESTGTEFVNGRFSKMESKDKKFIVHLTNGESYSCRTLILAYGKAPRALGIPGEEKFVGRGVSVSAVQDAPLYSGKRVAVIGGGNSALESAELLAELCSKVYLVHRRQEFRAEEITVERVRQKKNVQFVLDSVPLEVKGGDEVEKLLVENVLSKEKSELAVDGVFIDIGFVTDTSAVKDFVKTNEAGEVFVNAFCETSCQGIFAAGDITNIPYKQTIVSAGHGATAGLSAYSYLQKLDGKSVVKIDWS